MSRQTLRQAEELERKAPMHFDAPNTSPSPCIRCGHPVPVTRTLEAQDGRIVLNFVTVSVICDECWLKEPEA